MILHVGDNINRYYVQTLCMVFFPGAKFSEDEEITPETPRVTVSSEDAGDFIKAKVTIAIGEISVTAEHSEQKIKTKAKIKTEKVALGAAFLKAGEKFFKYSPSWGILTGVRPTKIVRDLIEKGASTTEIRSILTKQYFVIPKKASLVLNIAQTEHKKIKMLSDNTCSVYISIPFCPSRCNYCSFVSYSTPRLLSLIEPYLKRLDSDIKRTFSLIKELGFKVSTVYIGGGTPSILNEYQISHLLEVISGVCDIASLDEFTFEAGRPDTVNKEKLKAAYEGGVTRVCINPQTLNDSVLENIGRRHTAKDFYRAFDIAKNSGIGCINTDLIAGLSGESFASWVSTIDGIMKLHPDNVTVHTFCVKRAADIVRNDKDIFSRTGGTVGKCVDFAQLEAKNAGYIPYYMYRQKNTVGNYENVGFSVEGKEGLYNIYMMEEVHSIFAIGAGAVTKMVSPDHTEIRRIASPKYPYEYLAEGAGERLDDSFEKIRKFCSEYR
ncbi:MAG: coproporphyrinogen dehydrogenase HemZ [Clostridia bacterium]|nr:coproporphyrinogen dehydrogenase HemZ [Clostridia bacterium]